MSRHEIDILVIGGGPAGAAAAALLATDERRVALLESRPPPSGTARDAPLDARVVALSPGSRRVLDAVGGWAGIRAERIVAYDHMHVETAGGALDFHAPEHGLEALGWIVETPGVQTALWRALAHSGRVEAITGVRASELDWREDSVRVRLEDGRILVCRIVIGADGARSWLRTRLGWPVQSWYYNQQAIVAHLDTEQPNPGTAWQRFTGDGPLALLPLPGGRSSLVWSVSDARAAALLALAEPDFLHALAHAAGTPFGAFIATTRRHAFPLIRRRAQPMALGAAALVGDAARSVHPLAGQGLNLGLADAAALAECLQDWSPGQAPARALQRYGRWRYSAGEMIAGGIHGLNALFSARLPGLDRLRGTGLALAGRSWLARDLFVRRACGQDADSPALQHGAG